MPAPPIAVPAEISRMVHGGRMSKKLNKAEMLALVGAELLGRSEMCYLNDAQDIEAAEMEHNAARVRGFIFVRQGKAFFDGTYQAASVPSQSADPDVLQARRIADLIVPQVLQFWRANWSNEVSSPPRRL